MGLGPVATTLAQLSLAQLLKPGLRLGGLLSLERRVVVIGRANDIAQEPCVGLGLVLGPVVQTRKVRSCCYTERGSSKRGAGRLPCSAGVEASWRTSGWVIAGFAYEPLGDSIVGEKEVVARHGGQIKRELRGGIYVDSRCCSSDSLSNGATRSDHRSVFLENRG